MYRRRWISQPLLSLLIELKDYSSAAQIISASCDVYAMYACIIDDTCRLYSLAKGIARAQNLHAGLPILDLKRIIDTTRQEIAEHEYWHNALLVCLPPEDDKQGPAEVLRQSLKKAAAERQKLQSQISSVCEKYLYTDVISLFSAAA
jgi:hypothetical protein